VGAVGGADLDQLDAGAGHDVGDAEGAADLDQFAAGNQHFAFESQRVQRKVDRGGVVVDGDGLVAAGEFLQPAFDMAVAFAAGSAVEIELEVDRTRHRFGDRACRALRHHRAA